MALEIRLSGSRAEIDTALQLLENTAGIHVVRTSGPRENRRDPGVRVYATVEITGVVRATEPSRAGEAGALPPASPPALPRPRRRRSRPTT